MCHGAHLYMKGRDNMKVKNDRLSLRINSEDKKALQKRAIDKGFKNLSDYILYACNEEMKVYEQKVYDQYVKMIYKDLLFDTVEVHNYPFPIDHLIDNEVFTNKEKAYKFFDNELSGMLENDYELIDWEFIGYKY